MTKALSFEGRRLAGTVIRQGGGQRRQRSTAMLRRLGVIGVGGIAGVVLPTLSERLSAPLEHVSVLVPLPFVGQATELLDRARVGLATAWAIRNDVDALLADEPDVVAECASHAAVRQYGPAILAAGIDLVIISIGALADDRVRADLQAAAQAGGSRIVLPAGAIGAVDALAAARLSSLESVTYVGRKPPQAWRGTAAEQRLDLNALYEPTVLFEGNAREAARDYPFNANVAATLALAGIGFEETSVRLIADPSVTRNVHEFAVRSACGDFSIRLEGRPSPANPKTSLMAGYSIARELLNRAGAMMI